MKKLLLLIFVLQSSISFSQILFESFENTAGPTVPTWNLSSGTWAVFDNGIGTTVNWGINSTTANVYSGLNAAYVNREYVDMGLTTENYLATPLVTIPVGGQLRFFSRSFTIGDQGTLYQIKVALASGSQNNPVDYNLTLQEYYESNLSTVFNIYEEKVINFPPSLYGQQVYIAFVKIYTQPSTTLSGDRWLLDNVSIVEQCLTPTQLTVNSLESSTELSWSGSSANYEIENILQGATPTGNANAISSTNTISLTNLSPNTSYCYYARSVCSAGIYSEWVGPLCYTTPEETPVSTFLFCGDAFIDSGGLTGNYQNSENSSTTICPSNINDIVTVNFASFNTEGCCDRLMVYEGTTLIGTFAGTNSPGTITSSIAGGCLTFVWSSDGSVTSSGWAASINCAPAPACSTPTNVVVNNILSTSVSLSWNQNQNPDSSTATNWGILALPCGSPNPISNTTGWITTSTNDNFTFTQLNPSTCYCFYVKALCSENENSEWTSLICVTTLPLAPSCGDIFTDSGGIVNDYQNGENITTSICADDPSSYVSVTFTSFITEGCCDHLMIYDGSTFLGTFSGTNSPGTVTSNIAGGCLTFVWSSDGSVANPGWVAEVTCSGPVTCPKPTNFSAIATSPNSAILNWTENGSAQEWEIEVSDGNSTTNYSAFSTSFSIENLLQNITYIAKVRAICSSSDISFWSIPQTFTISNCSIPQSISVNNVSGTTAELSWGETGSSNSYDVIVQPNWETQPNPNSIGTITTNNFLSLTNLFTQTTYDVYIRSVCGLNYNSDWSNVVSFTTLESFPPLSVNATTYTPEQLITSVLMGDPCVTISNVTSSTGTNFGSVNGLGHFTNSNPTFGLSSGIVLSTGNINNIPGPNDPSSSSTNNNWPGDQQLFDYVNAQGIDPNLMSYNDATKLEFDFTTLNEFMSFNFLFASDEYGTFQCNFSDTFAFFLTDLTTGITTNIAVVPGTTTPISVVTIRDNEFNSSCTSVNEDYFDIYNNEFNSAINVNGQTMVMTASSPLIPNNPYHIKLVIADRNDSAFDSAIFIQGGSFTSGPPQCSDKINLVAFIDENNNGIKDGVENDFTYGSFLVEQNNDGVINSITSPIGTYTIYDSNSSNLYDFNYTVNSEYGLYYTASTVNYNDINIPTSSGTQTLYFPVVLTQGFNDVTVSISPLSPPRAGFNYTNRLVYTNLGVAQTSGTVTFTNDSSVSILNISQTGIIANSNGFSYDFINLQPYETRYIDVILSVPSIPIVNIDEVLTNTATISSTANDINLTNNSFSNSQIVVASYDPNDIIEVHGEKIQFEQFTSDDYLYYTIRFQNTGTANALNVRLENILNNQLDEDSIRMVSASHNYVLERIGNSLVWKFNYINLVGALQSEELSKGYATYKIKLKPGFAIGDIIPNTASIFFDTNPAITTNTFNTEFVSVLRNENFDTSNLLVFPNPANNNIQVNLQNTTETINSVTIFDVLGKKLNQIITASNQNTIDVSNLSKGVYFVEISTKNNLKIIKKLIKH